MIPGLRARARRCVCPLRARPRPSAPCQGANSTSGFALLAVLWVLTALVALAAAALAVARTGSQATRNRILLARAEWAREACGEILLGRYAQDAAVRSLDTVDLGRGTWCTAALDDPSSRLNLNLADRAALVGMLRATAAPGAPIDSLV